MLSMKVSGFCGAAIAPDCGYIILGEGRLEKEKKESVLLGHARSLRIVVEVRDESL